MRCSSDGVLLVVMLDRCRCERNTALPPSEQGPYFEVLTIEPRTVTPITQPPPTSPLVSTTKNSPFM
jgi:hypothetical protein